MGGLVSRQVGLVAQEKPESMPVSSIHLWFLLQFLFLFLS